VQQAELNLGYTKITAPIEGVAGFANNQVGDLVGPSTGPLTTVSQIDPIKAIVTAGEGPFTDFVSRHPDQKERDTYIKTLDFHLILGNGEKYQHKGTFYALDRNLDPKTGSIRYYVTFPNPGNVLRPGQFGKVRFVADQKKGAMVVPQEAVNELQGNFQVAVVDQDNKVSLRPVKMGERIDALWEVTDGLKPGDRVIVQGAQKVKEGSTVTVKEWTPPAPSSTPKASRSQATASPQKP
jgi:membrane fusion protein (multidrug efflux system)